MNDDPLLKVGPDQWCWCGLCGNNWASGSKACGCAARYISGELNDPEAIARSFPDPQAALAAYLVGGEAAVHAIERELFKARGKGAKRRARVAAGRVSRSERKRKV